MSDAPPATPIGTCGTATTDCVDGALLAARSAGLDRLDALALLAALLERPRSWLLAHGEAPLDAGAAQRWQVFVDRRAGGEPLAYLLGSKEFFGLHLRVTPDVLVPRPDTETLVDWALDLLPPDADTEVLDLGTGSGAVALAIASRRPGARVSAVDASAAALAVARENGSALGLSVDVLESDWFSALGSRRFGLIVGNPPYVAEGDDHLPALRHEPLQALVSGPDGLSAIRHIVATAPRHLLPGAWLVLEHGFDQADAVQALCTAAGLAECRSRRDLAGHWRCTGGRWQG